MRFTDAWSIADPRFPAYDSDEIQAGRREQPAAGETRTGMQVLEPGERFSATLLLALAPARKP